MKIISGGQTGADQSALSTARLCGIETGGWAPKEWLTETGPEPLLASYGLEECEVAGYPARTRRNIEDSDGTVIFHNGKSGRGSQLTFTLCQELDKPVIIGPVSGVGLAQFVRDNGIETLNVAGTRLSRDPDIERLVEVALRDCFSLLRVGGYAR